MSPTNPIAEHVLTGLAASGGVVHGKVLRLGTHVAEVVPRAIDSTEVDSEIARFREGLLATRQQIQDIQAKVSTAMGSKEADIFDAHVLVLEDPTLVDEILRSIRDQRSGCEYAVQTVAQRFISALEAVRDPYLSERAADVRDVTQRLINTLVGGGNVDLDHLKEPVVLVAEDLTPSVTALLDRNKILGFATDTGGLTSHTAIMARKLRIPAVVGLGDVTHRVHSGDYVLVDGHGGQLVLQPTDATLFRYGQIRERRAALEQRLGDLRDQPAVTLDGIRLKLAANIDDPSETGAVRESGAEGVGLFRTEFLFLKSGEAPDEEQHYVAYRAAAESLAPAPVVIRTMDLGGDKLPGDAAVTEQNPFLGWRAIRISLAEPELFRTQLRAILRASAHGNVKLMYPMISSVEELLTANVLLDSCRKELVQEGHAFDPSMEVGVMIEVPSAALIAHELAKHVQFFSLGTNDLTQYTLAVDRMNPRVASLYCPTHPAVIRLIRMTVEAARSTGAWVGVCGETAGDPAVIPLLVGLGVEELSATPSLVPAAKFLLRRLKRSEAVAMTDSALRCETADQVFQLSKKLALSVAPELFSGD